jgi:hypothetical protein
MWLVSIVFQVWFFFHRHDKQGKKWHTFPEATVCCDSSLVSLSEVGSYYQTENQTSSSYAQNGTGEKSLLL